MTGGRSKETVGDAGAQRYLAPLDLPHEKSEGGSGENDALHLTNYFPTEMESGFVFIAFWGFENSIRDGDKHRQAGND